MTLNMETEYQGSLAFDCYALALKTMQEALDYEACPYEAEINLILTGETEIQQTNREFRGIDRVTDVLSFPMLDFEAPGDFSCTQKDPSCFHPDTGELMLGDIMICMPRMQEQAASYGHGEIREFAFLVAHSMLHLMGYDHMTDQEAEIMEKKQAEILENLGITR